ncbi:hypothetical protein BDN72DRAFT_841151 [Pluteus cervinus]|uniref:Uncharacterized protein n=1 Tax=Pluteus cervinus TaxID=181527 RepID=A0ACD3AUK6_9AGAR|nr:hypothetical protein BDN72DRAFT_841151 [Pluteus cervinus]
MASDEPKSNRQPPFPSSSDSSRSQPDRRRFRSQSTASPGQFNIHAATDPRDSSINLGQVHHPSSPFGGASTHFSPASLPYPPPTGPSTFVGPYFVSPSTMGIPQHQYPQSTQFGYPQRFHHAARSEGLVPMHQQHYHGAYGSPILPSQSAMYSYHQHSGETPQNAPHGTFTNHSTSPHYSHLHHTPSPSAASFSQSSAGGQPPISPIYPSGPPGTFPGMRFSPTVPPQQFPYHHAHPPFSTSPQFAPTTYGQVHAQSPDPDQGGWWYHAPPLQRPFEVRPGPSQPYYPLPPYSHVSPLRSQEPEGPPPRQAQHPGPSLPLNTEETPLASFPFPLTNAPPLTRSSSRLGGGSSLGGTTPNPSTPSQSHSQTQSQIAHQTQTQVPAANADRPPSSATTPQPQLRPVVRRSYHPNPPPHRSEWVMWAGNVPSDATHDELWRLFTGPTSSDQLSSGESGELILGSPTNQPETSSTSNPNPGANANNNPSSGVLSIFLIARSNCAFINYENEDKLNDAIGKFSGVPLRQNDPRCPKLVCRVRRKEEDLQAGVGGQRGVGMHVKWVKDRKGKKNEVLGRDNDASSGPPDPRMEGLARTLVTSLSMQDGSQWGASAPLEHQESEQISPVSSSHGKQSSSSGSYASTNSSILARYFPQRYFILKSLTQYDLDLSVEKGLWATQKHNEGILDQAYRTSKDVFLIFGVNRSGEFYGYARMTGPVIHGQQSVPWASRSQESQFDLSASSSGQGVSPHNPPFGSRFAEGSPTQFSAFVGTSDLQALERDRYRHSAPPKVGAMGENRPTLSTGAGRYSLDHQLRNRVQPGEGRRESGLGLGERWAQQPMSGGSSSSFGSAGSGASGSGFGPGSAGSPLEFPWDSVSSRGSGSGLGVVDEAEELHHSSDVSLDASGQDSAIYAQATTATPDGVLPQSMPGDDDAEKPESWGESFRIQWITTERLPFNRARHLRNPWNHDREVKVSRDGTELEPGVGKKLLEEWEAIKNERVDGKEIHTDEEVGGKGKGRVENDRDKAKSQPAISRQSQYLPPERAFSETPTTATARRGSARSPLTAFRTDPGGTRR